MQATFKVPVLLHIKSIQLTLLFLIAIKRSYSITPTKLNLFTNDITHPVSKTVVGKLSHANGKSLYHLAKGRAYDISREIILA